MGLLFHKCIGMGELMMDQTGIQTSAHWNSSMVLSYLALVVESVQPIIISPNPLHMVLSLPVLLFLLQKN